MKGHSGGTISMGKGSLYCTSVEQKMVTYISTESEVIGVCDTLPQVIWTTNFLKDQRYIVQSSMLHQDNQSSMLLDRNGWQSGSKRKRHINILYFSSKTEWMTKNLGLNSVKLAKYLEIFSPSPYRVHSSKL